MNNPETRAITNEQSRDTGNAGLNTQNDGKQSKGTTQKTKLKT